MWCVGGAAVDKAWQYVCNHCLVALREEDPDAVDLKDTRIACPKCPHLAGNTPDAGTCTSTCKHSGMTEEKVWESLEEAGSKRVDAYREKVRDLGGVNPRQVAGQSLDDLIDYFESPQIGSKSRRSIEMKD